MLPPPDASAVYIDQKSGRPSKDFYNWIKSLGDSTSTSTSTSSTGDITLEMFGGVGDGVADDTAAWAAAWAFIEAAGGGFLVGLPGKEYRIDTPDNTTAAFVQNTTNVGLRNIKLLSTNALDASSNPPKMLWLYNNDDSIIFENVKVTAWNEAPSVTPRGLDPFVFTDCKRVICRNCYAFGGRSLFYHASQAANALDSSAILKFENIETDNTHYPIVVGQSGAAVTILNQVTNLATRSLFAYACRSLRADISSTDSFANDVILVANRTVDLANYLMTDVEINYSCKNRTLGTTLQAIAVVMRSDGTGGAVLQNARFNFDVTISDAAQLLLITRQTSAEGSEVGNPARGHVVDNVWISGKAATGNLSQHFNLFADWPAGEVVRNIKFDNFIGLAGAGSGNAIDTTCFGSSYPLVIEDVSVSNAGFTFGGTPNGTIHYRNYSGSDGFFHERVLKAVGGSFVASYKMDPVGMSIPYSGAKASLPAAASYHLAYVSDPAGGKSNLVISDGAAWRYTDWTAV